MLICSPQKVVFDIPFDPASNSALAIIADTVALMIMIAFRLVDLLDDKPMVPWGVILRFPRRRTDQEFLAKVNKIPKLTMKTSS